MNKIIFLSVFLLATSCLAAVSNNVEVSRSKAQHTAERRAIDIQQGNAVITKDHIARRLDVQTSDIPWRRMKIYFDLTQLNHQNAKWAKFYKKVYELVGQWWEQAVWIKDSKAKANTLMKDLLDQKYVKTFNIPEEKGTWKDYDLLIHASMAPTDGTTLAWAGPLYRHPDNQRPITGEAAVCWFGDQNFHSAKDGVNRAVGTMIHEFAHVMSFISMQQYHPHFVHFDQELSAFLWTGYQVRQRAVDFYGCKLEQMKGIALQNMGGKPGAHWSESTMADELMTPYSGKEPEKVSPMMLAFMEDSFWYKSDYSMVENYTHNMGNKKACYQKKMCPEKPVCKKGTSSFVTSDYKGIGYCSTDENKCEIEVKYSNMDVTKPSKWTDEFKQYGGRLGSKTIVVQGSFLRWNSDATSYSISSTVPVKAVCSNNLNTYTLKFYNFKWNSGNQKQKGDARFKCTKKGTFKFNCNDTYCSEVKCYSPMEMCSERYSKIGLAKNKPHCHKSCMKNGRCQPGHTNQTPAAQLIKKDIMAKLRISRRRRLQRFDAPETPAQPETFTASEHKPHQCWCYSNGKRQAKCPSINKNGKVTQ